MVNICSIYRSVDSLCCHWVVLFSSNPETPNFDFSCSSFKRFWRITSSVLDEEEVEDEDEAGDVVDDDEEEEEEEEDEAEAAVVWVAVLVEW